VKRLVILLACACGGGATKTAPAPKVPAPKVAPQPEAKGLVAKPEELTGVVKKVRVQGASDAQRGQVEAELAGAKDKAIGSDELRAALGRVMRIAGIADVTVQGIQLADGIELVVEVTGQPVMRKLTAIEIGGKTVPLGIGAITPNAPLDPHRIQLLAQTLRERYVTNGYFDAEVTWKRVPVAGGVEVTIEVVTGPASSIDAVTFTGTTVPKKDLDAVVASWLVVGQPVVEERITSVVQVLEAYYWDRGHANVRVHAPKVAAGKITLAFKIDEGPKFKMGAIEIKGVPAADRAKYLQVFAVKQGDLFSRTAITSGRDKLSAALVAAGKPNVVVLPLTKVDIAAKRIGLTLEITGAE
jgi:outer membrane protein insertion porin family